MRSVNTFSLASCVVLPVPVQCLLILKLLGLCSLYPVCLGYFLGIDTLPFDPGICLVTRIFFQLFGSR